MFGHISSMGSYASREDGCMWTDQAWEAHLRERALLKEKLAAINAFASTSTDREKRMSRLLCNGGMSWNDSWEFVMLCESRPA